MTALDWSVLLGTLALIAGYGVWKTRGPSSVEGFIRGGRQDQWHTIGLSVMATQASAITFLSTPGQAYEDGMRFVQFYFGLPIAMVVLSVTFVPLYYRLRVHTAYEFLERRFDRKTRQLAALLFLIQRGLAAGITIYAPAIILSTVMGWSLNLTNLSIGLVVILYTVSGGTRAVSQTQKHQMIVMLGGMVVALVYIITHLPQDLSLGNAVRIAAAMGKTNIVDTSFDLDSRYTLWSGIGGGFFLAMAYFGTDQSQVQRYLSGRSITESRLGLLFNGLLKIPMQFLILSVGVMVFVFHQFVQPPVFFNEAEKTRVYQTAHASELRAIEASHAAAFERKRAQIDELRAAMGSGDEQTIAAARASVRAADADTTALRKAAKEIIGKALPRAETKDSDYIFISFVLKHLPRGLIGLLLAVIFCAAMSSVSSELAALGSTTMIDFYKRSFKPDADEAHYLLATKGFTVLWGALAVLFATFASLIDNLIQAVNILGSLFYGTILGIFLVAFFLKRVRGTPVFLAAVISEAIVITVFRSSTLGFLWFNVIGCTAVVVLSLLAEQLVPRRA